MSPLDWISLSFGDDLIVNIAIIVIVGLTVLLLWEIVKSRANRRKSKRDDDFDRFQDQ